MVFNCTIRINKNFYEDEFTLFIIYGPLRYGKSSLAFQILAEVYKTWDPEILKNYIGFHPEQVLDHWSTIRGKIKAYVWDDAGLWLHALDWTDPFIKSVGKYLNVAGSDFAGLILTTPLPTWISKKVRGLPQAITLRVRKVSGMPSQKNIRQAVAYRYWLSPDLKHSGVKKIFIEQYNKMLPERFYNWYKPFRDKYTVLAKGIMRENLKKLPEDIDLKPLPAA